MRHQIKLPQPTELGHRDPQPARLPPPAPRAPRVQLPLTQNRTCIGTREQLLVHFQLRLVTVTHCFGQSKLNCFLIVGSAESSRTPRRCLDEKQMPAGSGIFTTLLLLPALFEACLCQPGRIPALHPSPPGTDPAGERRYLSVVKQTLQGFGYSRRLLGSGLEEPSSPPSS